MEDPRLKLNENGRAAFYILDGNDQIAEMDIVFLLANSVLIIRKSRQKPKEKGWQKYY